MLIDITLQITPELIKNDQTSKSLVGHMGTHFDVMDKVFPLAYTERKGIAFDVSGVTDRDIEVSDICLDAVEKEMFVAFYTGYIEREPYGSRIYFAEHPQLSHDLINALLDKEISVIGVDCAGIRRGKEHISADQACADRNVFVVENLCNLKTVLDYGGVFHACTYPLNCAGMTGIPCRVIARA